MAYCTENMTHSTYQILIFDLMRYSKNSYESQELCLLI